MRGFLQTFPQICFCNELILLAARFCICNWKAIALGMHKGRPKHNHNHFFELISRNPIFRFWGSLDDASNTPSTQWKTEKTQWFLIWCAIKCRFDVTSDAIFGGKLWLWLGDKILRIFFRPEIGPFSPHFGAISLVHYTKNPGERGKIHWREFKKSSGDGAPKLQMYLSLVVVERVLKVIALRINVCL